MNRMIPRLLLAPVCAVLLQACSGGSGTEVEVLPNTNTTIDASNYSGPAPQSEDVQRFKVAVWDNLVPDNRCGSCHGDTQQPVFVNKADVNLAYEVANQIVDLGSPSDSLLVTKVAGGHNCWLDSDQACADILINYIEDWADGAAGTAKVVELKAPAIREPGASRNFPTDPGMFAATVHPLLEMFCADCHTDSAEFPQGPFFASSDIDVAYAASKLKIDLDNPDASRFVVRLGQEFHNCWSDCGSDAEVMRQAIEDFAAGIEPTEVDPDLVLSKALRLEDGILAAAGGRFEDNVIALYEFKTGSGRTAFDTSGVEPALDLQISGNVEWVGGWGLRIVDGKAQGSTAASAKLHDRLTATGEYSIEAWVAPANVTQEEARIVSYSGSTTTRNFMLGQTLYNYDFLNRADTTNANGEPALSTADADERLQATLQHVVITYHPADGRRIYVNGEYTGDMDEVEGGLLTDWDDSFALVVGNEVSGDRLWQGTIRLLAIHERVLSDEQIASNFEVGVGEKFFLLFAVGHLIDVPDSYVVFTVSQFDSYSYLFDRPFFISLAEGARPQDVPLEGMRIGINGREARVGQAWATLATTLREADYGDLGIPLSRQGTIIALEKGPQDDEFFLSFERIGDFENVFVYPEPPPPAAPADLEPQPRLGLRTFAEINATMSVLTGVATTQPDVAETYELVRRTLPVDPAVEGFASPQQMGVTQLAIEYCNALVEDGGLRAGYFPGFDFGAPASAAFASSVDRNLLLDPLLERMLGTDIDTQPDYADVRTELNALIDRLTACGGNCAADRTETVAKASCAAVLGSATMLLQ